MHVTNGHCINAFQIWVRAETARDFWKQREWNQARFERDLYFVADQDDDEAPHAAPHAEPKRLFFLCNY